jgi:hypothetical protein
MVTCSACALLSVNQLRKIDYKSPYLHHSNVGELKACVEASSCGICVLLWRTMDDLTRLDSSKPAIRDHPDETYGLYGQFYDDFDFDFGGPYQGGGLPSFESAIKIEATFLTYNLGLSRIGIRLFAIEGELYSKSLLCFEHAGRAETQDAMALGPSSSQAPTSTARLLSIQIPTILTAFGTYIRQASCTAFYRAMHLRRSRSGSEYSAGSEMARDLS